MVARTDNYTVNFRSRGIERVSAENRQLAGDQSRLAMASKQVGASFNTQSASLGAVTTKLFAAAGAVYTVTGAFTRLKRAAELGETIRNLDTLGALSAQSGREVLNAVQEITRGQVGLAEATRSIALGFASGFSREQIEGLTTAALKASRALGIDLTQAQERLTKAAAKREKELLDELGLFVRLDDASAAYAKSLGISANELTEFQKTQAFTNAIIEEATRKFSTINVEAESTTEIFTRVGAQISNAGIKLGITIADFVAPAVSALSENMGLVSAGALLFATRLTTSLVPALSLTNIRAISLSGTLASTAGILQKGLGFPLATFLGTTFFLKTIGLADELNSLIEKVGAGISSIFSGDTSNVDSIGGVVANELNTINLPATINLDINKQETRERLQRQVEETVQEALNDRSFLDRALTVGLKTAGGALSGGLTGAGIGSLFGGIPGALLGGAVGAGIGGLAGFVAGSIKEGAAEGIAALEEQFDQAIRNNDFGEAAFLSASIKLARSSLEYKDNLVSIARLAEATSKSTEDTVKYYRFLNKDSESFIQASTRVFGEDISLNFLNESVDTYTTHANDLSNTSREIAHRAIAVGNTTAAGFARIAEVLRSTEEGLRSGISLEQYEKNIGAINAGLVENRESILKSDKDILALEQRKLEVSKLAPRARKRELEAIDALLAPLKAQRAEQEATADALQESVNRAKEFRDVVTRSENLNNYVSALVGQTQNPFEGFVDILTDNGISKLQALVVLQEQLTQEAKGYTLEAELGVDNSILLENTNRSILAIGRGITAETTKIGSELLKMVVSSEKFYQNLTKAAEAASKFAENRLFALGQEGRTRDVNREIAGDRFNREIGILDAQNQVSRFQRDQIGARTAEDREAYDIATRNLVIAQENLYNLRKADEEANLAEERRLIALDRDNKIEEFRRNITQRKADLEEQRKISLTEIAAKRAELGVIKDLNQSNLDGLAKILNTFQSNYRALVEEQTGRSIPGIGEITADRLPNASLEVLTEAESRVQNSFDSAIGSLERLAAAEILNFYNRGQEQEEEAVRNSTLTQRRINENRRAAEAAIVDNKKAWVQSTEDAKEATNGLFDAFKRGLENTIQTSLNDLFGISEEKRKANENTIAGSIYNYATGNITSALTSFLPFNKGGIVPEVQYFNTGGSVRDTVPAMLEPGEFVIKRSSVDAIGVSNLARMNESGTSGGAEVVYLQPKVNIINQSSAPNLGADVSFDPATMAINAVLKDIRENGPTRQAVREAVRT